MLENQGPSISQSMPSNEPGRNFTEDSLKKKQDPSKKQFSIQDNETPQKKPSTGPASRSLHNEAKEEETAQKAPLELPAKPSPLSLSSYQKHDETLASETMGKKPTLETHTQLKSEKKPTEEKTPSTAPQKQESAKNLFELASTKSYEKPTKERDDEKQQEQPSNLTGAPTINIFDPGQTAQPSPAEAVEKADRAAVADLVNTYVSSIVTLTKGDLNETSMKLTSGAIVNIQRDAQGALNIRIQNDDNKITPQIQTQIIEQLAKKNIKVNEFSVDNQIDDRGTKEYKRVEGTEGQGGPP